MNVFPIGAITKGSDGEELAAIGSMKAAGVVAISDDGRPVMNARVMRRAMETASAFGLPVINHCEDLNLSAGGDMHEGVQSTRLGLRGIPSASEDVMVARDILLAEVTGARYHVAHISTRHSVAMVAYRESAGSAGDLRGHAASLRPRRRRHPTLRRNYKMKPPLRCCCDVEAVAGRHRRRHGGCARNRSRSASRQREDAGVREVPVRHPRPRNSHRLDVREAGPTGQDLADEDDRALHDRSGPGARLNRGTLAAGRRCGRYRSFDLQPRMDV